MSKALSEAAVSSLKFLEKWKIFAQRRGGSYAHPLEHFPDWEDHPLSDVIKWRRTVEKVPTLAESELEASLPVRRLDKAALQRGAPEGEMQVTWLGHASVLVQFQGWNILADPIFSKRCSPVQFMGPQRVRPSPVRIEHLKEDLPRIDAVCISHNHYDHLDQQSVVALNDLVQPPVWFVPMGTKEWMTDVGVESVVEMEWGQQATMPGEISSSCETSDRICRPELVISCLPCQHWCARGIFDRNKMLWASWAFTSNATSGSRGSYFFGGDTGYCGGVFRQIGSALGQVDVAALPIGAYGAKSEEWFHKASHMNPEQAVQTRSDLNAKHAIAMHWGTFQLTAEPLLEPPARLERARKAAGLADDEFVVFQHGETRCFTMRNAKCTVQKTDQNCSTK